MKMRLNQKFSRQWKNHRDNNRKIILLLSFHIFIQRNTIGSRAHTLKESN